MARSTISETTAVKTVVGIFGTDRNAVEAMRSLDRAGFDADRVQMVADNESRAAEIGGKTYALEGGIAGLVLGVLLVAAFAVWGSLSSNPIGLIIGGIGVVGGCAAIGFVVGRALGRHAPDAHLFADVVSNGGAVVSVQCAADSERELAAKVLGGAGARAVRDEPGPEVV